MGTVLFLDIEFLKNDRCSEVLRCSLLIPCVLCRLIPSSGDAQNRETRSFAQGVSRKILDAIAKAKVILQIASIN